MVETKTRMSAVRILRSCFSSRANHSKNDSFIQRSWLLPLSEVLAYLLPYFFANNNVNYVPVAFNLSKRYHDHRSTTSRISKRVLQRTFCRVQILLRILVNCNRPSPRTKQYSHKRWWRSDRLDRGPYSTPEVNYSWTRSKPSSRSLRKGCGN